MRAKTRAGQVPSVGLKVRYDDGLDATPGQGGDRGQADGPGPDHNRHLAGLESCAADIELTDGEGVGQRYRVVGDTVRNSAGDGLRDHHEFGETAGGIGVLADDVGAVGTAVDQPDGDGRHAGTERELCTGARSVPDDLPDELMAQHDVLLGVVQRPTRRVVEAEFGVIHEVHVGGADRGARDPQEQFPGPGNRIGHFLHRQLAVPQHDCAHSHLPILE